jgi:superfamily II DNA or RNA helicase
MSERDESSTGPEDRFVELFAQVFGIEKVQLLAHEFPVEDIYGGSRFVDYAIRTPEERVAFEIDGLTWHAPEAISVEKHEDDLFRQNSLIHFGWRLFRWTDRQIMQQPEEVKDQLALFLERIPGLLSFEDFLPRQRGEVLELRAHQEEALIALDRMRSEGKTIGLLPHAQGAGKTVTAICDAQRVGGRTLFIVHTRELVTQAYEKFRELWPESTAGLYFGGVYESDKHNVVATIQTVSEHLVDFSADAFDYIVVDEAHHAAAPSYRRVLAYFRPKFILGLTATPDRAGGESILGLFQECAHRLGLREAIEAGELVPVRCVRVQTNVNLSKVRYNQLQYNRRDIEETVLIPARDRLIVDTYLQHVPQRKAVAFAVNVRHGEALAELFRLAGIPAGSVSGRMPRKERERHLKDFNEGRLRVLCACDLLNEGWDCPDIEVLLMARPTLSKVIYLQQLGRGTRKAPGKECLVVFDFVDNATRYSQSLSLHRILKQAQYRPGGLVLAPQELLQQEAAALAKGAKPTSVIDIALWAKEYQEIDVFNWQEVVSGMLTAPELEVALAASEGVVRRAIERRLVQPDHSLNIGDRAYHYFTRERTEEVWLALGLPKVDDKTIKELFAAFVAEMDMSSSYKPVMLMALLDCIDSTGRARLSDVVKAFRRFYEGRKQNEQAVERPTARMSRVESLDDSTVQRIMLEMPFEKFERRKYLRYDRDLAYVKFDPVLWRQLATEDLAGIRSVCDQSIATYFGRLDGQEHGFGSGGRTGDRLE